MLPTLIWNLVGPSSIASTSSINIISNLQNQIQSSQFWELVATSATGSNSMIIKPVTSNARAASENMNIVITNAITGSSAYLSPDDNTSNAARMQVGLVPDITENGSGTFIGANSDRPFGTNVRWTGYMHCGTVTSLSATFLVESEESIFIGFRNTTRNIYAAFVGAILESYDSVAGENHTGSSGRYYGVFTTGANSTMAAIWTSSATTNIFLSHQNTAGANHAGVFFSTGSGNSDTWQTLQKIIYTGGHNDTTGSYGILGNSSASVAFPNAFSTTALPWFSVGRGRGFHMFENSTGIKTYVNNGTNVAYGVAPNSSNAQILFAPASGSV